MEFDLAPAAVLVAGFLADQCLGDPALLPHPVRWIGHLIHFLEPPLRILGPDRFGGCLLLLIVAATTGGTVWAVLELAGCVDPWLRFALMALLTYYGLAARSLAAQTKFVLTACEKGDWPEARQRLASIVGRDTLALTPPEIYRACIETVGENTTDAVIAPLFYAVLGGPVALWVYKAINTLDSMVGYRNERYLRFGWASARADDLANFVPARLTWLLMTLAALLSGRPGGRTLRIGWRDGRKHPSPNSAWGEATMAGALGIQLGGPCTYQGTHATKPRLGDDGEPLSREKASQAVVLMLVTAWLGLILACVVGLGLSAICFKPGTRHASVVTSAHCPLSWPRTA